MTRHSEGKERDRPLALTGFAVQFPGFYQRICMITPENVKEVVARELRNIAKEMYNPKLGAPPVRREGGQVAEAARKRRREAPDFHMLRRVCQGNRAFEIEARGEASLHGVGTHDVRLSELESAFERRSGGGRTPLWRRL